MQDNDKVNDLLREQIIHLQDLQNGIIAVFTDIIMSRGAGANGHIERTISSLRLLTENMISRGIYTHELKKIDIDIFCSAARLYDIGKLMIPISILNKPGKLTNEEFEIMKTHAMEGEHLIDQIASKLKTNMEFINHAQKFAGYHHERWDGLGYPRRLDRLNIPIQGRMMAVIDVFDALASKRHYKEPFTPEEAEKIILDSAGEMFDPLITDVFVEEREQFFKLYR